MKLSLLLARVVMEETRIIAAERALGRELGCCGENGRCDDQVKTARRIFQRRNEAWLCLLRAEAEVLAFLTARAIELRRGTPRCEGEQRPIIGPPGPRVRKYLRTESDQAAPGRD